MSRAIDQAAVRQSLNMLQAHIALINREFDSLLGKLEPTPQAEKPTGLSDKARAELIANRNKNIKVAGGSPSLFAGGGKQGLRKSK